VVESSDASDRFLWDFRRTIADLVIAANFEGIRDALHERGMKYVTEAMASGRAMMADAMEMKTRADYPMGEMWLPTNGRETRNYYADIRDTASVANIYGKKIASAESVTSGGGPYDSFSLWDQKLTADEILLGGVNQMTLHVSVLQPNDQAPGLALSQYGMWVTRHQTYAEQTRAWTDYIARSCYLLQQGRTVMDVAYFYGEEAPSTAINEAHAPTIADGYNYDFVNRGSRIELDLGTVHVLAEVAVNGKTAGIAWKPPYRVDITDAVKAGANTVSIKVVNLWPNRLIGDMQPGAAKVAFAPNSTYTANSPLMPSGLIGPVAVDLFTEIQ